ncbi:hypothetical protein [Aeromicrobium fastidiosum]|uniref:Terminase n=1 Tax=Aeromicrobium fastidiosum TaxID=52699 RepID=A0A641ARE2_9ACTN|nr:hypothetical protein [Aeromicrobium fastidiosum]KAA1380515.1 hypothetical protein ESP62_004885 [Aeromicrobium fastidiosum]MBP2390107.1 hypothetical protein [Aeromicrobium fastidiosum]
MSLPILEYRAQLHEQLPSLMPPPKFATDPDLSRLSLGRRQDRFSQVWLGKSFMPHQKLISDVAGELVEDPESGLLVPAYALVLITLQRQAGKSHLDMAQNAERCFTNSRYRSWYTAQTGSDARDQFLKFQDDVVDKTPLDAVVRTLRGSGREMMIFPNKSTIRPYAPTDEGLHGKQSDRNTIDEGWAFSKERGKILLQGSGPTELTRPNAQTFILSAGGTAESTWLADLVSRGRAGEPGMAFFEFGVPDDMIIEGDLTDDVYAEIARHHPAVGHTITVAALKKLRTKLPDDAEFARAAGNRWTEIIGGSISKGLWESVRHGDAIPAGVPVGYGAARAADGSEVVIAAAADLGEFVVVEILDVLRPFNAAAAVNDWTSDGELAVDRVGPSSSLADGLDTLGRKLMSLTTRDVSAGVANILDGLKPRAIRFRQHPALDDAVKVAGTRPSGDGGKLWARVAAGASIAALEAATLAVWAVGHRPPPTAAPTMRLPGE